MSWYKTTISIALYPLVTLQYSQHDRRLERERAEERQKWDQQLRQRDLLSELRREKVQSAWRAAASLDAKAALFKEYDHYHYGNCWTDDQKNWWEQVGQRLDDLRSRFAWAQRAKSLIEQHGPDAIRWGSHRKELGSLEYLYGAGKKAILQKLERDIERCERLFSGEDLDDIENDFEYRDELQNRQKYGWKDVDEEEPEPNPEDDTQSEEYDYSDLSAGDQRALADAFAQLAYALRKGDTKRVAELREHISSLLRRARGA